MKNSHFEVPDTPLTPILAALEAHGDVLAQVRSQYLAMEAERQTIEARMVSEAPGKSHAERENNAKCSEKWLQFRKRLNELKNWYESERLKHDVLNKEYLAVYLSMKLDGDLIKKQE